MFEGDAQVNDEATISIAGGPFLFTYLFVAIGGDMPSGEKSIGTSDVTWTPTTTGDQPLVIAFDAGSSGGLDQFIPFAAISDATAEGVLTFRIAITCPSGLVVESNLLTVTVTA